jgi:hypothetical protein
LENKGHTFALMQPNCDFIKGWCRKTRGQDTNNMLHKIDNNYSTMKP